MIFDTRTGKIITFKPRRERIHYFSIFFAKCLKRLYFLKLPTSPALTAYYSRAYTGVCSTSQYYSQECPGTPGSKPGKPRNLSPGSPKISKNHHFMTPGGGTIRIDFPLLLMLISITETSSEHDF